MDSIDGERDKQAAGAFGDWLGRFRDSLRGRGGMDVPCGECTGCCTSGYSVQLRPEDRAALAVIPAEFLVSATGFPRGHLTMAPRPDGRCRMLSGTKCSIYRERPQTCLDYDCRIFAAAGLAAGGSDKSVINQRVRAWRFSYPADEDRRAHEAVLSAASFILKKRHCFGAARVPTAPTGIAVLAIKSHVVFLDPAVGTMSDAEIAAAIIDAGKAFDEAERGEILFVRASGQE